MKLKFFLSMAVFLLAAFPLISQSQVIPQIALGTPYANVRTALLKAGWKPVRQKLESYDFMGIELRDNGWIEVESCAGTGMAPCLFVWRNQKGKRLEVVTVGENPKFNGFR